MLRPPPGADPDPDWVALAHDGLPADDAIAWATTPASGAVVSFVGVVRDHAEGRSGVHGMTYEAYEEHAEGRMREVAAEARRRWPAIERLVLLHRVGELALSEASVLVVVSAPHRGEAFDAARFGIDAVKETVPIWKQEHWDGGSSWARGDRPIRSVAPSPSA